MMRSRWNGLVVALSVFAIPFANEIGTLMAVSTVESRFLEVLDIEELRSPGIHLGLLEREITEAKGEVKKYEKAVDRAERALEQLPKNERGRAKDTVLAAQRELKRWESKLARAKKNGLNEPLRAVIVVNCWDGFAKRFERLWFLEESDALKRLRAGSIVEVTLTPLRLTALWRSSDLSPRTLVDRDTLGSVLFGFDGMSAEIESVCRNDPEGFLRFTDAKIDKPWESRKADPLDVSSRVIECPMPSQTALYIEFIPPSGRAMSAIKYRLLALDAVGNDGEELTPPGGIRECRLGPPKPRVADIEQARLVSYVDPGRRFAHGFKVVVEEVLLLREDATLVDPKRERLKSEK
jgi:hypothetical protein